LYTVGGHLEAIGGVMVAVVVGEERKGGDLEALGGGLKKLSGGLDTD
jgi:hypothetical protein